MQQKVVPTKPASSSSHSDSSSEDEPPKKADHSETAKVGPQTKTPKGNKVSTKSSQSLVVKAQPVSSSIVSQSAPPNLTSLTKSNLLRQVHRILTAPLTKNSRRKSHLKAQFLQLARKHQMRQRRIRRLLLQRKIRQMSHGHLIQTARLMKTNRSRR